MTTPASLRVLLEINHFNTIDEVSRPGRAASFAPAPAHLSRRLSQELASRVRGGLFRHQALALQALGHGDDVALATPTASGKSLVFQTHAAHLLLQDPNARVIAVYPSRALIADQLVSWTAALAPLGQRAVVIDGGVPVSSRDALVRSARVLLMTPDVMHAWLLGRAQETGPALALRTLSLLILDEAHVYDGAFGTNVSYFLRRLQALASPFQLLASTATVGEPVAFLERLTGRSVTLIDETLDGSEAPAKRILLASTQPGHNSFEARASLVRSLASGEHGRFLVFGDSRLLVEKLTAAVLRAGREDAEGESEPAPVSVLPYRAGYEEDDRAAIQRALEAGQLAGVISTSALELGIDIGAIETVLLLSPPPSMKSFWQRVGRAGRRSTPGACIVLDDEQALGQGRGALDAYLARPIEPNRLYLDNRYIQYAHALCAAHEASRVSVRNAAPLATLPPRFQELLDNELFPKQPVAADLYPLKQRAADGPHQEFPLRNATERDFTIESGALRLGRVTQSQMMREAYPGALYFYMARSYRVVRVDQRKGKIEARRQGGGATRPTSLTMVFPRFRDGLLKLIGWPGGFLAEVEVQVSERVTGFVEKKGQTTTTHLYGPDSPYARAPLTNFVQTTGVCWHTPGEPASQALGELVREAFCRRFGIQEQDIGVGPCHAQASPSGAGVVRGLCVYDATCGSLRLTELLALHFEAILEDAEALARSRQPALARDVAALRQLAAQGKPQPIAAAPDAPDEGDPTLEVIALGQRALYLGGAAPEEVQVIGLRYTPQGLFYQVQPPASDGKRLIAASLVQPLAGQTEMFRWDPLEDTELPGSRHLA